MDEIQQLYRTKLDEAWEQCTSEGGMRHVDERAWSRVY